MEPNLSGNQDEKINARNARDAGQPIKAKPNPNSEGLPKDPVYGRDQAKARVSESYEGFSNANAQGMPNLEKSDGFGSKFQMPGPDMSEKYGNKPLPDGEVSAASPMPTPAIEGFVDIQTSIQSIQSLVQRIRENLASPEQAELESLLQQGVQLLSTNWKQLAGAATEQFSSIKSDVRENPYRSLIAALKVGVALGQVMSSGRAPLAQPAFKDEDAFDHVAL